MQIKRREFLLGALASGVVVSSGTAGKALASTAPPAVALLQTGTIMDRSFARGLATASTGNIASVPCQAASFCNPKGMAKLLGTLRGHCVAGLMEDRDFVLFHSALRAANGSMPISVQHVWGPRGSRHLVTATPQALGVAAAVAKPQADIFTAEEPGFAAPQTGLKPTPLATDSPDWAERFGEVLGLIALGRWQPGPAAGTQLTLPNAEVAGRGSLTSFVAAL